MDITRGMAVFWERVLLCEKYECLFLQYLMRNSQDDLALFKSGDNMFSNFAFQVQVRDCHKYI